MLAFQRFVQLPQPGIRFTKRGEANARILVIAEVSSERICRLPVVFQRFGVVAFFLADQTQHLVIAAVVGVVGEAGVPQTTDRLQAIFGCFFKINADVDERQFVIALCSGAGTFTRNLKTQGQRLVVKGNGLPGVESGIAGAERSQQLDLIFYIPG